MIDKKGQMRFWREIHQQGSAFERQLRSDMGLKSLGLLDVFTLFNAITSDFFHSEGKTDCLIDVLKSSRRWIPIDGKAAAMKH